MKTLAIPLSVLRVGGALILAAACFQVGRWTGQLERSTSSGTAAYDAGNEMIVATHRVEPLAQTVEPKPAVSAGDPTGQDSDIITPLNVRDPSALVMGPGGNSACPPPAAAPVAPPEAIAIPRGHKLKTAPLPEGRLLELMPKDDKKSDQPKAF